MNEFLLVSGPVQYIVMAIFFVILIISLFLLIKTVFVSKSRSKIIKSIAVSLLISFAFYFLTLKYIKVFKQLDDSAYMYIPMWLVWIVICICLGLVLLEILNLEKEDSLGFWSAQEALDNMSVAISYFDSDGDVRFCNKAMKRLYWEICEKEIISLPEFKKELKEAFNRSNWKQKITGDEMFLVVGSKAYSYEEHDLNDSNGNSLVEEKLRDITEFYDVGLELEEQIRNLRKTSRELKKLSEHSLELVREEEILSAKTKLHNQMGSGLVALRMLLVNDVSKEEETQAIELMRSAVDAMKNDNDYPMGRERLEEILWNAGAVGVDVKIEGVFPKDRNLSEVFLTVLQESLTNSVKHGYATEMTVRIDKDQDNNTITITNNGVLPKKKISQKGGLLNMEALVKNSGGSMTLEYDTQFTLRVSIPVLQQSESVKA